MTNPTRPDGDVEEVVLKPLRLFMNAMDRWGDWDDGCFYYSNKAAPELQEAIKLGRAALARTALEGSSRG